MPTIVLLVGALLGCASLALGHDGKALACLAWTFVVSLAIRSARPRWDDDDA